MRGRETNRDLVTEALWHDRRGVVVTSHLLAEALEIIESEYGVGRALNQRDIADAAVTLIHARLQAQSHGRPEQGVPFPIRPRDEATTEAREAGSATDHEPAERR